MCCLCDAAPHSVVPFPAAPCSCSAAQASEHASANCAQLDDQTRSIAMGCQHNGDTHTTQTLCNTCWTASMPEVLLLTAGQSTHCSFNGLGCTAARRDWPGRPFACLRCTFQSHEELQQHLQSQSGAESWLAASCCQPTPQHQQWTPRGC